MAKLSQDELAVEIGKRVQLTRRGQDYWGLSPFHNEKTPSFHVYQGRNGEGRYHDFGTGADGDSIDWSRAINRTSYREAAGERYRPPSLEPEREREQAQVKAWNEVRDRHPDLPDEARHFVEPEPLRDQLLRHLHKDDQPMSNIIELPPQQQRADQFVYLDKLRASGEPNMYRASAYLMQEFGLGRTEAREVLLDWMHERQRPIRGLKM